ncbi:hypothetical protein ACTMU2_10400 [Cupriavidus basilensis]
MFAILHNLAMTALRRQAGSRGLHVAIEDGGGIAERAPRRRLACITAT